MKKTLIRTIAVSLIAASFFSVTTVKSANADDIIGSCGQYIDYSNRKAAAMFAESLVGQPYSQMPKTIKDVKANWCAAFVRYVYGSGNTDYNSVTLIKNASGCFIQNPNYEPEIGDLVIYEEDGNPGNGYEHIGIVVKGGKDYETVEGNAFYIEKNKLPLHQLKLVLTTGEMLMPDYRDTIERVFNCKVGTSYVSLRIKSVNPW